MSIVLRPHHLLCTQLSLIHISRLVCPDTPAEPAPAVPRWVLSCTGHTAHALSLIHILGLLHFLHPLLGSIYSCLYRFQTDLTENGALAKELLDEYMPVSYTHLSTRQHPPRNSGSRLGRSIWTDEACQKASAGESLYWQSTGAVSYTHLDVYKRQE